MKNIFPWCSKFRSKNDNRFWNSVSFQATISTYCPQLHEIDLMSRFQRLSFITFRKYNLKGIDTCHILHSEKRNWKIKFLLLYFNIWILGLTWQQWCWWLSLDIGDRIELLVTLMYIKMRCRIVKSSDLSKNRTIFLSPIFVTNINVAVSLVI